MIVIDVDIGVDVVLGEGWREGTWNDSFNEGSEVGIEDVTLVVVWEGMGSMTIGYDVAPISSFSLQVWISS